VLAAQHSHDLLQQERLARPAHSGKENVLPLAAQVHHMPLLRIEVAFQLRALVGVVAHCWFFWFFFKLKNLVTKKNHL
jgi:hypothetical protein